MLGRTIDDQRSLLLRIAHAKRRRSNQLRSCWGRLKYVRFVHVRDFTSFTVDRSSDSFDLAHLEDFKRLSTILLLAFQRLWLALQALQVVQQITVSVHHISLIRFTSVVPRIRFSESLLSCQEGVLRAALVSRSLLCCAAAAASWGSNHSMFLLI